MVEAESERHNASGVRTNFIVDEPAEPANAFEEERYADYESCLLYTSRGV